MVVKVTFGNGTVITLTKTGKDAEAILTAMAAAYTKKIGVPYRGMATPVTKVDGPKSSPGRPKKDEE